MANSLVSFFGTAAFCSTADLLADEMHGFIRAVNQRGNVTIEGRRQHDDLILAVALAMWARVESTSVAKSLFADIQDKIANEL
jgi:hypothetical protein